MFLLSFLYASPACIVLQIYLARSFDGLAQRPARRFARERMADELVVGRMHDKCAVLNVLPDAEEAEIPDAALGDEATLDLQQQKQTIWN